MPFRTFLGGLLKDDLFFDAKIFINFSPLNSAKSPLFSFKILPSARVGWGGRAEAPRAPLPLATPL